MDRAGSDGVVALEAFEAVEQFGVPDFGFADVGLALVDGLFAGDEDVLEGVVVGVAGGGGRGCERRRVGECSRVGELLGEQDGAADGAADVAVGLGGLEVGLRRLRGFGGGGGAVGLDLADDGDAGVDDAVEDATVVFVVGLWGREGGAAHGRHIGMNSW